MPGLDAGYCPCPPRSGNKNAPPPPGGCDPVLVGEHAPYATKRRAAAKRRMARHRVHTAKTVQRAQRISLKH